MIGSFADDVNHNSWGRILCAVGYAPVSTPIDPTKVSVSFVASEGTDLKLLVNGEPEQVDEVRAKELLEKEDLEIKITLGLGSENANYYTCDFSHVGLLYVFLHNGTSLSEILSIQEYVTINGDYRS